ncbi:MAG: tetratricopeptide repeat protein [Vampirovibrionia bacterium]
MKKILLSTLIILYVYGVCNETSVSQPLTNNQYAIAKMKEELAKYKDDQSIYMSLCLLYSNEKDYDNMLDMMRQVVSRFSRDTNIAATINDYAMEYSRKGEYDIALKIIDVTLSKYKRDQDAAIIKSEILLKKGDVNGNISFLSSFLKKNPEESLLYDRLADSYIYKKDYQNAFETIRTIQDKHIDNIYYYFLEAMILQMTDKEKAIKYFEAYLEKIQFVEEYGPRIKLAQKINKMIRSNDSTINDYEELIEYMLKNNVPKSYILIQARYALKDYPDNAYLEKVINDIYTQIGIKES